MGEESGNVFLEWKGDDLRNRPGEIGWLREKRGGSRSGAGRTARYENRFFPWVHFAYRLEKVFLYHSSRANGWGFGTSD
jgi:hypothetical protein